MKKFLVLFLVALTALAGACSNNAPVSNNSANTSSQTANLSSTAPPANNAVKASTRNIIFFYRKEASDADKKKFENELFYGKADAKGSEPYVKGIENVAQVSHGEYSGKNVYIKLDAPTEFYEAMRRAIKASPIVHARYDNMAIEDIKDLK